MVKNQGNKWDVYMSGALSDVTPEEFGKVTTEIYDRVERVCESMGLTCYCPHKSPTTPTKGIPHSKVWKTDYERVVGSGAVVAYIGIPALGVGAEIEMARTANVPVVLLCETSKQERLSRLILGNPAVVDIVLFEKPDEFEEPLRKPLFYVFSKRNLESVAFEESWTVPVFRHLEVLLNDTVSAVAHRNFPGRPVTKEEWKSKAMQKPENQKTLFEK